MDEIVARMRLPFFKIFSDFAHFSNILPFFSPLFLPFFWKIARMPILSRTGPVTSNSIVSSKQQISGLKITNWILQFAFRKFSIFYHNQLQIFEKIYQCELNPVNFGPPLILTQHQGVKVNSVQNKPSSGYSILHKSLGIFLKCVMKYPLLSIFTIICILTTFSISAIREKY